MIDTNAADCHLDQQEGAYMAAATADDDVKICVVCHRDPRKPPPDWKPREKMPRDWKGSEQEWIRERWAKAVKVVAHGRCARDYQVMRRPESKRNPAKGADARLTTWVTPETKKKVERIAAHRKKTVSAYTAQMIEAQVEIDEKAIP